MPALSLAGHKTLGHGGFPPTPLQNSGAKFRVGGVPVALVGTPIATHSDGDSSHGGTVSSGSSKVKVGGVPVAMVGSAVSCGDILAQGTPKVVARG